MRWMDMIVRGLISLMLVGATVYIWTFTKIDPPLELVAFAGMAIGQYLPTPGRIGRQ